MQVLVVDHSGLRGRLCESVLDKLCEDVDAAVDTMTSSIGPVVQRPDQAVCEAGARLGLSRLPLEAGARRLRSEDLRAASRWDLIVCVDLEVLELVREMAWDTNAIAASQGEGTAASEPRAEGSLAASKQDRSKLRGSDGIGVTRTILCMSDFLASGVPPLESARLPEELRRLIARRDEPTAAAYRGLVDLPRFGDAELQPEEPEPVDSSDDSSSSEAQQKLELADFAAAATCTTLCCAGLVAYLEAAMREHALRIYRRDLRQALRGRGDEPWELPWAEVQAALQLEHAVPGGLSEEERQRLFAEEAESAREGSLRTRVDVFDLGLTMDDLKGPMGGT